MAVTTPNIGLKKWSIYDLVKLDDFNGNSDILDEKIGAVPEGDNLVDMVGGIIDDESGEGDTDKTWSADKLLTDIHNVPAGGTSSQVLAKASDDDYDLMWVDQTGGGGGGDTNYNNLSNKPKINDVTLQGSKTADELGLLQKGAQTLTAAEKTQVRTNIGAADAAALSTIQTKLTNLFQYKTYEYDVPTVAVNATLNITANNFGFSTPSGYKPFAILRFFTGSVNLAASLINGNAVGTATAMGIRNIASGAQSNKTASIGILYIKTGMGI